MAKAATILKSAPLSSEFGLDYAVRLFGAEAVDSLPRLKAGPNKGKPKGHVMWLRTTTPGYHVCAGGGVPADVTVRAWIAEHAMAPEGAAMVGQWLGRLQPLCGSRALLGEENRNRWMAEQARDAAEREAMLERLRAEESAGMGGPRR